MDVCPILADGWFVSPTVSLPPVAAAVVSRELFSLAPTSPIVCVEGV